MFVRSSGLLFSILILSHTVFAGVGDISRKKCKEYNKLFHKLSGKNSCPGIPVPLILGGNMAFVIEFPHMAAIGFSYKPKGEMSWLCGGSLISERFVLTAAHCLKSRDKGPAQKVRLGDIDVTDDTNKKEYKEYFIIQRIQHPNYKPPLKYNDIALLKLNHAVKFTLHVRPACLHIHHNIKSDTVIATGYGKQAYDEYRGASTLMKVKLPILSLKVCNHSFAPDIRRPRSVLKHGLLKSQMCVGDLSGGKDTCQGDSGGPIQIRLSHSPCTYSIVGVTSFGKFCGYQNAPSIYTRVSSYIKWIEQIIWAKHKI